MACPHTEDTTKSNSAYKIIIIRTFKKYLYIVVKETYTRVHNTSKGVVKKGRAKV
jgi:hypothetical protein